MKSPSLLDLIVQTGFLEFSELESDLPGKTA
jgi:hypothetical protein